VAKQQVVEVQCDRCKRKEYKPSTELDAKGGPDLHLAFLNGEVDVTFEDLCASCKKAVSNYVESIKKKQKGKSPERGAKEKPPGKGGSSSQDSGAP
jgi:ribosomal protein L44E